MSAESAAGDGDGGSSVSAATAAADGGGGASCSAATAAGHGGGGSSESTDKAAGDGGGCTPKEQNEKSATAAARDGGDGAAFVNITAEQILSRAQEALHDAKIRNDVEAAKSRPEINNQMPPAPQPKSPRFVNVQLRDDGLDKRSEQCLEASCSHSCTTASRPQRPRRWWKSTLRPTRQRKPRPRRGSSRKSGGCGSQGHGTG